MKFRLYKLIGKQPINPMSEQPIPEGAIIFNAPRPICGSEFNGYVLFTGSHIDVPTWLYKTDWDDRIWGFTAIVTADDPRRADWFKENKSLDATVLQFVDEAQARQELIDHYYTQYSKEHVDSVVTGRYFEEDWQASWNDEFGRGEIEI